MQMGGLLRRMPVTGVTFVVGALALAGVPPLGGFLREGPGPRGGEPHRAHVAVSSSASVGGAAVRALHRPAGVPDVLRGAAIASEAEHAHESPPVMTVAARAAGARRGAGGPARADAARRLSTFLEPVLGAAPEGTAGLAHAAIVAIAIAVVGGRPAHALVRLRLGPHRLAGAPRADAAPLQRVLEHGWYVDDYYSALLVTPGKAVAAWLAYVFDTRVIDGVVNGIGAAVRRAGAQRAAAADRPRPHVRAGVPRGRGLRPGVRGGPAVSGHLLSIVTFLPLLGAVVLLLWRGALRRRRPDGPRCSPRSSRSSSRSAILGRFDRADAGFQMVERATWVEEHRAAVPGRHRRRQPLDGAADHVPVPDRRCWRRGGWRGTSGCTWCRCSCSRPPCSARSWRSICCCSSCSSRRCSFRCT